METPTTAEEFCAQHLATRSARIVADLHRLAERVEREAGRIDRVGLPGIPSYATIAADIVHAVMGTLPNLNFHGLVVAAQDADEARVAEHEVAPPTGVTVARDEADMVRLIDALELAAQGSGAEGYREPLVRLRAELATKTGLVQAEVEQEF